MNDFQPVHAQIKDYLLGKIRAGEYGPGDRVPPQKELTKPFRSSKSPLLVIERFYSSEPGGNIEWGRSYCRPDFFKHRSILPRG